MTSSHTRKPIFVIFAARNGTKSGVTGAAIGTETMVEMLSGGFDIEWVELKTNGLGQLAPKSAIGKAISLLAAAIESILGIAQLAWRGMAGPKVEFIYFLPAATAFGMVRNALFVAATRIFYRHSKLLLHIRNGNYFEEMAGLKARLRIYVNGKAHRILVLSQRLLPEHLGDAGVQVEQVCVLPNTIDNSLVPEQILDRPPPSPLRVLYLSNFIEEKGYLALLRAAELLALRGIGAQFAFSFYGKWLSDAEKATAQEIANNAAQLGGEIGIHDSVFDRSEVQRIYSANHVFCLPTLYAAEAQPRSVLEAMANGCAVLATDYRSIPDQVVDGETGLLVADQDAAILADRLVDLSSSDVQALGEAGRALFDQRFSKTLVQQSLLNELLADR